MKHLSGGAVEVAGFARWASAREGRWHALDASLDLDTTLDAAVRLAAREFGERCTLHLCGDDQRLQLAISARVDPDGRVRTSREVAAFVGEVSETVTVVAATGRTKIQASELIIPLIARSRTLGTISLGFCPPLVEQFRHHAEEVAYRVALAIDNARLYHDAMASTRERDELIAVVSHDLRNPLNSICLSAKLIDESLPLTSEGEQVRARVQAIQRCVLAMTSLIADLLDRAPVANGRINSVSDETDITSLVDEVIAMLSPLADVLDQRIETEASGAPAAVCCNRTGLLQVLSNLIANAIKFSPAEGTIRVRLVFDAFFATVSVTDQGRGIPADDLPRVFDRYWHGPAESRGGRGLGLYIAKTVVEAHGGRIWGESHPCKGATFTFVLPVALPGSA
jgi:signal transduction histidine kinase